MKNLTAVIALVVLTACNKPKNERIATNIFGAAIPVKSELSSVGQMPGSGPGAAVPLAARQLFNLAQHVKETPSLSSIHDSVAEGNAYLHFGSQKLFRVETNLIIDANAEATAEKKGLFAQYFLDTFALGKKLPNMGHAVDIGASATLATPSAVEAHIRFLGDDKWKVNAAGKFDQSFMRDIPFELPFSPLPIAAAVVIGGAVGGEIGLRGELGARMDNAAQIVFIPRVNMQVKLKGGIKLIQILKADAVGSLKLIELLLYSAANMGAIPSAEFMYGNIGVEASQLTSMDGKLDLVAGVGYGGILPGGLDKKLISTLVEKLGFGEVKDLVWKYTLWDPKPIIVKEFAGFGKPFMSFYKEPGNKQDCQTKAGAISKQISGHKNNIAERLAMQDGLDKKVSESNVKTFDDILGRIAAYCK